MTNRENEPPFDGSSRRNPNDGHDLPLDVEALLRDFPGQLDRLKEASGLSWSGLARTIGVDRKRTRLWSRGSEPRGGSILSLFHLASRIPGGLDILLGRFTEPEVPGDEVEDEENEEEQEDGEA